MHPKSVADLTEKTRPQSRPDNEAERSATPEESTAATGHCGHHAVTGGHGRSAREGEKAKRKGRSNEEAQTTRDTEVGGD